MEVRDERRLLRLQKQFANHKLLINAGRDVVWAPILRSTRSIEPGMSRAKSA